MSAASGHEAIFNFLKANTSVTGLLQNGASDIYIFGRLQPTSAYPAISVGHGGSGDFGKHGYGAMFFDTIRVRVYYKSEQASLNDIEKIVKQLKLSLNKADLGTITGIGFLECRWTGYCSGDLFDPIIRSWYRELRVDVFQAAPIA